MCHADPSHNHGIHVNSHEGDVVRTVATTDSLELQSVSVAQLIRAAGCFVEIAVNASARDHEIVLEKQFLEHELRVYEAYREPQAEHPWSFVLSHPRDVEEVHDE